MKVRKETYDVLEKYRRASGPKATFDNVIEYLVLKNDPLLPQAPEGFGRDIRKDPAILHPELNFERFPDEDFKGHPEKVGLQIVSFLALRSLKARLLADGTGTREWIAEWNSARLANIEKSSQAPPENVKEAVAE
jgi:hypothetical protein